MLNFEDDLGSYEFSCSEYKVKPGYRKERYENDLKILSLSAW